MGVGASTLIAHAEGRIPLPGQPVQSPRAKVDQIRIGMNWRSLFFYRDAVIALNHAYDVLDRLKVLGLTLQFDDEWCASGAAIRSVELLQWVAHRNAE